MGVERVYTVKNIYALSKKLVVCISGRAELHISLREGMAHERLEQKQTARFCDQVKARGVIEQSYL